MTTATQARYLPVPRVRELPLLGSAPALRRDRLAFLLRLGRLGDIVRFGLGPRTAFFVNAPALIHEVLVAHAGDVEKMSQAPRRERRGANGADDGLDNLLGNGLLTSANTFHRSQRKILAPAFQPRRVAAYGETMAGYAEEAARGWPDGAEIDIAAEMTRLTLRVIGRTLFGADVRGDADGVGAALTAVMRHGESRRGPGALVPASWPTPAARRFRAARAHLDAIVYRLIAERRRAGAERGDLLSALLRARDEDDGRTMDDRQVRDEAMTLFLAGHETTANALAWTWYLLALHPAVAARLRAEVDAALSGRTPTVDDLPRLPYTLRALKESMRLYPPAYALLRYAVRPLDVGGHRVPAGATILLSPYALHRRPDTFPDPARFDPDRFLPVAEEDRPRHSYLPFGAGPRACIGAHFALMEGHLILATLAQRAAFTLTPGQRVAAEPLITLRPRFGIRAIVQRRDGGDDGRP